MPSSHSPSVSCEIISISKKPAYVHICHPGFCGGYPEDTPLDSLALVPSKSCVHSFNGMVAKKETVSNWLSPQGSVQSEQTETLLTSLPMKEVYLCTLKADVQAPRWLSHLSV